MRLNFFFVRKPNAYIVIVQIESDSLEYSSECLFKYP